MGAKPRSLAAGAKVRHPIESHELALVDQGHGSSSWNPAIVGSTRTIRVGRIPIA
jgi:hypothetical protein